MKLGLAILALIIVAVAVPVFRHVGILPAAPFVIDLRTIHVDYRAAIQ